MTASRTSSAVFDEEFLSLRAKLIELAASLDRIERAEGVADAADPRFAQIRAALELLLRSGDDRAAQIQLLFSRPYEEDWQRKFRMKS